MNLSFYIDVVNVVGAVVGSVDVVVGPVDVVVVGPGQVGKELVPVNKVSIVTTGKRKRKTRTYAAKLSDIGYRSGNLFPRRALGR